MTFMYGLPSARFLSKNSFITGSFITAQVDACHKARRRYGEPRFDMWLCVPVNSPDCLTEGSIPANAANLADEEKRVISPISLKIVAPRTGPIPGIVVMYVLK